MSNRLLAIMTEAGLAPLEIQRAQLDAQRQAQNTAQWVQALQSLAPLAGQVVGGYQDKVVRDADAATKAAVAAHAGDFGAQVQGPALPGQQNVYGDTPQQVAQKALDAAPGLELPQAQGSGLLDQFLADPLGLKSSAVKRARADASAGIAQDVVAARDKNDQRTRQAWQDQAEANSRQLEDAARKAQVDNLTSETASRSAAAAKAAHDAAVQQAVLGMAPGTTLAQLNQQHPEFSVDELNATWTRLQRQRDADKLGADAKRSEIAKNYAEAGAARDRASNAAKAATEKQTAKQQDRNATVQHLVNAAAHLDELGKLYDKGKISDGLTGWSAEHAPMETWSEDRSRAHQLASEAALEAPSTISGAKRLNETELKAAKQEIVGTPGNTDSNTHRAQRARDLAKLFREEAAAQLGVPVDQLPSATIEDAGPQGDHAASDSYFLGGK